MAVRAKARNDLRTPLKSGRARNNSAKALGGVRHQSWIRVVLADDHAVVRAGIRQILETATNIKVVAEAENGEQAIEVIRTTSPDVAVLDIRMPKASGIDVTKWVRENAASTAVLVLSAYDDNPYVLAALQAGANGYVLKNADAEDIVRAVCSVHAGKSAVDPEIAKKVLGRVSSAEDPAQMEVLTVRERQVLEMVARGRTNKAIGSALRISARTVQGHLAHIFDKLQAESRTEAVMRAVSLGWLPSTLGSQPER
jgi:DNA-binding NarL/FixJ family response regulator